MSRVLDASILLDFLQGDKRSRKIVQESTPSAISAVTWLQVMIAAPEDLTDVTRSFLRSFERLSISEAVVDEALLLKRNYPKLDDQRVLTWACARVNRMPWVTSNASGLPPKRTDVEVPYRTTRTWPRAAASQKANGRSAVVD